MSKQQNFVCDGCNEILYGKDRASFVKGNKYFTFKGSIAMQMVDDETGANYHFFVGYPDSEWSFHLQRPCFDEFLEREITLWHNRRRAQLIDEVNSAGGSKYVTKPERAYVPRGNYQPPASAPVRMTDR